MARRKSTARKGRKPAARKAPARQSEMPSGFGFQVFAVFLIILAIVIVFMWFGTSGNLLDSIHREAMKLIGLAVYLTPAALVYLAISIFRAEGNRLPMRILISVILMLIWFIGLFGVFSQGGSVGAEMDKAISGNLGSVAGFLIFAFLIFVTSIFILQVSPLAVFRKITGKSKKNELDGEVVISEPVKKGGLKISGEAKEPEEKKPKKRFSLLKKESIKKKADKKEEPIVKAEKGPERALVEVGDPNWKMPPLNLLEKVSSPADPGNVQQNAFIIKSTLADFGIDVEMDGANIGPRVTQYTLKPPAGVNLSKILARDKELALNLSVAKVRIEAPIPGTSLVGVEIPNAKPAAVGLRVLLESPEWKEADDPLTFAVGKDISGKSVVANLAKMPHLLIAGTTGSGKSVMTNAMIVSLLYRNSPSDLKFIIIDPKRVEMVQYADIPHLLTPIISETAEAVSSLKWAVNEMTRRYTLFSEEGVKNIVSYNKKKAADGGKVVKPDEDGNEQKHDGGKMPYIVIVIDEMSDIMMQAGKEMEPPIVRIAQMGRAAGIHLVLATQKPIVKVVTGLIKGNVPARIAFAVSSTTDSLVMLDKGGAEKLLGKGDMLMLTTEMQGVPRRIQGAMLEDEEEIKVANFLKEQRPPEYNKEVIAQAVSVGVGPASGGSIGDMGRRFDPNDPVVRKAVEITLSKGKFATAMLQTYLGKGHGFVSGLAIWFEEIGVIGEANGNKPREVLIHSMEEFDELANS